MNIDLIRVIPFQKEYDRSKFASGSRTLDQYLKEIVTQDIRRRVTACFIALLKDNSIAGFYTLSSSSVLLGDMPDKIIKKLPRYPTVPVVRMGRLVVDKAYQGKGLGGALLADALKRVVHSEIAAYALVVDAKDKKAAQFYLHHGFIETISNPFILFLPLATVSALL